jgi:hypothetical protein
MNTTMDLEERLHNLEERVTAMALDSRKWSVDEFSRTARDISDLRVAVEKSRSDLYKLQYLQMFQVLIVILGFVIQHFWK